MTRRGAWWRRRGVDAVAACIGAEWAGPGAGWGGGEMTTADWRADAGQGAGGNKKKTGDGIGLDGEMCRWVGRRDAEGESGVGGGEEDRGGEAVHLKVWYKKKVFSGFFFRFVFFFPKSVVRGSRGPKYMTAQHVLGE